MRDDSGFGLVEVVVSMAVITIISLVMVVGMTESFHAAALARQRSFATSLISGADAELQADSSSTLAAITSASTATTAADGVDYCTDVSPQSGGTGSEAGLYTFTITVYWPSAASCNGTDEVSSQAEVSGS